ncbi:ABC-type dipeptide/oligopeptide/nickel transport system, permease component (plasmid) [Neorhizobium galegae bv. officinalis bv. officinalis str. HAMBI 1141]|jgi:peptide/nickel transport system permease protein|uniref:ABC-type dipeptide/oligopeptide/nickel transport system, permease component n=1 Tax=Neorhizobium galegae bv. officinalis bv. officinalis str. HAMBI 1141 TaxID=1028801 RepID=A0A068TII6_NEOGA|nr:ABC transporter permease [Neorhizobium galegae]CDN57320.1 ABC-type dipeptide/oligopeptide/nickel transport system, permease component [Neorhizobium galegae bv. officinalis bv. officinalis str. HAMBI 1141]
MKRVSPILVLAIIILAAAVTVAIVGNVFTSHGMSQQNLLARLKPPAFMTGSNPSFPLGTDRIGRDMVARVIAGLRMSLSVAIAGTIIGAVVGSAIGFIAAHFRGWVEEGLMMLVDFQASLPFILITLTLLAFFGNSMTLFIILMGLFGWEKYARLSRGVVLSAINQPYAKAIVALGAGNGRLYLKHVLPNVASALIVQVTLTFPQIILLETSLSFLGLGIQAPQTSLGQILGDGRDYLSTAWWISVWPGLVIFLVTLSMSIVGDWLRDRLDPMLRARTT